MEPNKKKTKTTHEEEEQRDLDRLSSLPLDMLIQIFSLLETKSVVRTSVLSENFRHAWTLSPCLDFKLKPSNVGLRYSRDDTHAFESNVARALKQRQPHTLTSFRLSLHLPVSSGFVQNCIDYAAGLRVKHLRLRGYTIHPGTVRLPALLLTSTTLVTLRLNTAATYTIELPKSVSLPNLKGLHLKNFVFSEGNYNGEVFSGCPRLESLVLVKCSIRRVDGLKILEVNCLNLRSLEIRNWRSSWLCYNEHIINVNAPRLAFFKFQGYVARVDFKNVMPRLEKAYIDLPCPTQCSSDEMVRTSQGSVHLLRQIDNVRLLYLSSDTFQLMSVAPESRDIALSLFTKLKIVIGEEWLEENFKRLFWPPKL